MPTVNTFGTRTALAARGRSAHLYSLPAREKAGVTLGETYEITVTAEEAGSRTVEVPDDLTAALAGDTEARARFEALAYSHRKEFVRWITEAKREATRAQRVARTVEMLRAGETR